MYQNPKIDILAESQLLKVFGYLKHLSIRGSKTSFEKKERKKIKNEKIIYKVSLPLKKSQRRGKPDLV